MSLFISYLFLLSFMIPFTYIHCKSLAKYCTNPTDDYEVNKFTGIFTIGDKVYIKVGKNVSKYWVFDINRREVLTAPVFAAQILPNYYPIVEYVAMVSCDNCHPKAKNLLIAIGRKDIYSYRTFATFRMQSDSSFVKISNVNELPPNWKLRPEGKFSLDAAPYWGFFPEDVVTLKINSSNFHGFTFFAPKQIFILKYYNDGPNGQPLRHFIYRKVFNNGDLSDWMDLSVTGNFTSLKHIFQINDTLYAVNDDPRTMPIIAGEMKVEEKNGVIYANSHDLVCILSLEKSFSIRYLSMNKLIVYSLNENIDARNFFNCFDEPTTTQIITTEVSQFIPTDTSFSSTPTQPQSSDNPTIISDSTELETETTLTKSSDTQVSDITTPFITDMSDSTDVESENDDNDGINIFRIILFILLIVILFIVAIIIAFFCLRKKNSEKYYYTGSESKANLDTNELESASSGISLRSIDEKKGINLSELKDSPSEASLRSTRDPNTGILLSDTKDSPSAVSLRSTNVK